MQPPAEAPKRERASAGEQHEQEHHMAEGGQCRRGAAGTRPDHGGAGQLGAVPQGEIHATGCTQPRWSTGKNVPENSVIGMSTSRNNTVKAVPSSSIPAVKAATTADTATPVRTAASRENAIPTVRTPPNTAITAT